MNLRLGVVMFLQFFVWGAWYVSVTGWVNARGMSEYTALLYSLCPAAAIVSPLFLGSVADKWFASQKVLAGLHAAGAVFMLLAPLAGTGPVLVLLLLGHALCYMPTLALSSTVVLSQISNREKTFPIIRVCGTVGWMVAGILVAFLPGGDSAPHQFYLAAGAGLLLAAFGATLPIAPVARARGRISGRELLGLDALRMLRDRDFLVFILCCFFICICLSGYYQQARNFIDHLQLPRPTFVMSFGQMSEVAAMLVMPFFFVRLGIKRMLLVGMLAWVLRYGFFAAAAGQVTPQEWVQALVLAGILLHGVCYDFFFVTGQVYVDRAAAAGIRAQAQALFVLVTYGAGMLIGSLVFGVLAGHYGARSDWWSIWIWPTAGAFLVALLFQVLFADRSAAAGRDAAR